MGALSVKIDNKKYRIISENDYMMLLQDIKDIKKVLKRRNEKGTEAREFFNNIEVKSKHNK
jgi:phage anti-repressor protein